MACAFAGICLGKGRECLDLGIQSLDLLLFRGDGCGVSLFVFGYLSFQRLELGSCLLMLSRNLSEKGSHHGGT